MNEHQAKHLRSLHGHLAACEDNQILDWYLQSDQAGRDRTFARLVEAVRALNELGFHSAERFYEVCGFAPAIEADDVPISLD